MLQAPVQLRGGGSFPISIFPALNPEGRKVVTVDGLPSKAKLKKDKVARPPNAFILYRQHHHAKVVAEHPQLHNNQICTPPQSVRISPTANGQAAIILGQQWQNEKDEVKTQFKAMAEEIKKEHLNAHPDYQYQPRKPTEKKRRMTRRKAEKMAAAAPADPVLEAKSEAVPAFEETATGNAVFTLGDDLVDDDALIAMMDKHNEEFAASGLPFLEAPPALFSENTAEVQDDINFYGNLLDFDNLYREEFGAEELFPAEVAVMDAFNARSPLAHQNAFDQVTAQQQEMELSRMSNLWGTPKPKDKSSA